MSKKVFISGASGFVGQNLITYLISNGISYEIIGREELYSPNTLNFEVGDVIHLAGKAHDLRKTSNADEYYAVNFELTKKLYDSFLKSNAKKFIFISSVKAAADLLNDVLTEDFLVSPKTHYGKSKLMAEAYIQAQPLPEGKSFYILRPCMIHGPGNKGNLNLLYQFVKKGIPYPLTAFQNKRSFLSVKNLSFIISELINQDHVPSGIYNVADDEALSTTEVVGAFAKSMEKTPLFWRLPKSFIYGLAKIGDTLRLPLNSERLNKLTESYVVSNQKIIEALNVKLPVQAIDGLFETAKSFEDKYKHQQKDPIPEHIIKPKTKKFHQEDQLLHTCLITGGNGYLGKHILDHLVDLNYDVSTLGKGGNNTYSYDLSEKVPAFDQNFETVIHCAGKAHSFPKTPKEEQAFFDINVTGTKNLLAALERESTLPKTFVFISSVSVYGLTEGTDIKEETPLLSKYPYGSSKIEAERLILSWCKTHKITCLILRLPLLAGKNPPGNLKIMITGIKKGYYFNIAGKSVRKSVVMAEDVAKIIPKAITIGGVYNLTDGYHPSFEELADLIAKQLNKPRLKTIPKGFVKMLSFIVKRFEFISPINAYKFNKFNSNLTFDDTKARESLGWSPNKVLEKFQIK